jgi:hypothetical protein
MPDTCFLKSVFHHFKIKSIHDVNLTNFNKFAAAEASNTSILFRLQVKYFCVKIYHDRCLTQIGWYILLRRVRIQYWTGSRNTGLGTLYKNTSPSSLFCLQLPASGLFCRHEEPPGAHSTELVEIYILFQSS